jgi:hypothetical protein
VEEIEFRTINETRDQAIKNIIQMERMGLNVNPFKNIIKKKSICMYSETCAIRHLSSPTSIVPEDKVGNYIVFVNKPHYIDCLIKELGNPTYSGRHFQ